MGAITIPRFDITSLPLSGLRLIRRKQAGDARGFLERLFCAEELAWAGWNKPVAQINYTYTATAGTVRGMHFQHPPHAEKKLVMCMRGRVFDVVVDIRKSSPTFLKWHKEILSSQNANSLLIPEGFAHGFQTMTDDVEMLYCHSAFYSPECEGGLHPQDPAINIQWPDKIAALSDRDRTHPFLDGSFKGIFL